MDNASPSSVRPTLWTVGPHCRLKWRQWDDQILVYHCESGDTHLLNVVAGKALKFLQTCAASADEVTGHVASSLGLEADAQLQAHMQELLATFDELGLIEPVDEGQRPDGEGPG